MITSVDGNLTEPVPRRSRMPGWFLGMIISAAIACLALPALLDRQETWVTSDLDGHCATIELYRHALSNGIWWPYDAGAGFGHDATTYYGWWMELAMGSIALLLGALGSAKPAVMTGLLVAFTCVAAIPSLAGWAAAGLEPAAGDPVRRNQYWTWGALAGLAFLLMGSTDGSSAFGFNAVLLMGLLNQGIGWIFFLLVVGCALRALHDSNRRWIHVPLALAIAGVLIAHTVTAIAAAVVVLWFAVLGRRWVFIGSGILGIALAAGSLAPLLAISGQQFNATIIGDVQVMDPLLAIVASYFQVPFGSASLTAPMLLQLLLLGGGFLALRTPTPARILACAGASLLLLGILPFCKVALISVLPAMHIYRLVPLAGLLLLLAGVIWSPVLMRTFASFTAPTRYLCLVIGFSSAFQVALVCWAPVIEGPERTVSSFAEQLRPALPAGSRVVWANGPAANWNRTAIERLRSDLGIASSNALHSIYTPPPFYVTAAAARSVGVRQWAIPLPQAWPREVAIRGLQDQGVTHLVANLKEQSRNDLEPGPMWIDRWSHVDVDEFRIWTVPDPAPLLEPIAGELLGCSPRPSKLDRLLLAEWWSRCRARAEARERLVFATADAPRVHPFVTLAATDVDPVPSPYLATGWPRTIPFAQAINNGPDFERYCYQFYQALRAPASDIARRGRLAAKQKSDMQPSELAQVVWDATTQEALFVGLRPGQAYLWRHAWSAGFQAHGGLLLEEVGGFTVLIPDGETARVTFSRTRDPRIWIGGAVSCAAALLLLWLGVRRAFGRGGKEVVP